MLVFQMYRMPIENIGFTEFYYSTVMIFCAFGYAMGPVYARTRVPAFTPQRIAQSKSAPPRVARPSGFRYSDKPESNVTEKV